MLFVFEMIIGCILTHFFLLGDMEDTIYPEHSQYLYINDFNHVLSDDTEKYIYERAAELEQTTSAQVAVVTVPNTYDLSLEQFSRELGNQWKLGQADKDNGILLLFTTGEKPRVRLEVGRGLESVIPDGMAGRILDEQAVEPKNNRKFNLAAWNTFTTICEVLYKDSNQEIPVTLFKVDNLSEEPATETTFADLEFYKPKGKPTFDLKDGGDSVLYFILNFIVTLLLYPIWYLIREGIRAVITGDEPTGSSYYSSSSRIYSSSSYSSSRRSGGGGSFGGGGASR